MTELMKPIKDFERYGVTNTGKIYNYKTKKYLHIAEGNHGYLQVGLYKGDKQYTKYLHKLVADAFLELTNINPDGTIMTSEPEVNHKNRDKSDCDISNLEYCDRAYNLRHALAKEIYCIELDKVFDSVTVAAKELNILYSTLSSHLCGRLAHAGGYHFMYNKERNQ